jgi:dipeptidase
MDPSGDTSDPSIKREGAWERPISIYRCGYSYVCQARGWLPNPIGGIVWFGADQPMSTCYVPFYVGALRVAEPYLTCDTRQFDQNSAWWAFNFVANWAGLKYEYMIKDIQKMQDQIETTEIEAIKAMDAKALDLYNQDSQKARELLTTFCENQANQVVRDWWNFAWLLVARYADGFVSSPGDMAKPVGYPKDWYMKTNWPQGPTSYEKKK